MNEEIHKSINGKIKDVLQVKLCNMANIQNKDRKKNSF
jgi:hypothetical protein